jgi:hypothetical protein
MQFISLLIFALLINWICSLNNSIREETDKNTKYILIVLSLIVGFFSGLILYLI